MERVAGMCSLHCCANGRTATTLGAKCKNSRHARDAKRRKILAKIAEVGMVAGTAAVMPRDAVIFEHDLFRKPVSTHRVKPEGMLFGIVL
jgi:hypothetical protein